MRILTNVFLKLLEMSFGATLIGLLILGLKKIFKNIPVKLLNVLWIFVILLLLIPINIESKMSIQNYIPQIEEITLQNEIYEQNYSDSKEIVLEENNHINIASIMPIIWIVGSVSLLLKNIIVMSKVRQKIKNSNDVDENVLEIFNECKRNLYINNNIELILQNEIKTPVIFGVVSPKLLITKEVENLSTSELKYVFTHELIHYKKLDIFIYKIINALKCVYWFNAIILIIFRKIKNDLEYATDEITVDILKDRKKYCKVLLKISQIGTENYANVVTIYNGKKELERRIIMLKNDGKINAISICIIALLVIVVGMASISFATNKITENIDLPVIDNIIKTYVRPIEGGTISATYGTRVHPITKEEKIHNGIDIAAPIGTEIVSMSAGKVVKAEYNSQNGNQIIIEHDGISTEYNHLSKMNVNAGDEISAGQKIGEVGSTGMATGPHLHFGIMNEKGEYINPTEYVEF
ncbi:MAG: peptidoglycan DD-metalloendopeptidase family protein [Clostridia bacterium]|nr:peptidoglycan DD-metalloendopeptidase family protein [Clostridia bacterium]